MPNDPGGVQCRSYTLGGSRCDLRHGHHGEHSKTYEHNGYTFTWTDQSQTDLAGRLGT